MKVTRSVSDRRGKLVTATPTLLATGETIYYLIPKVNTNWLNLVYQQFAIDAGVNRQKAVRPPKGFVSCSCGRSAVYP